MSPVRALLRLSLVWGRAQGEAIHSKQLPNTGTAPPSLYGGGEREGGGQSSGRCFAANRHKPKAALNAKNTRRQRAGAFQVGSSLAEDVPGHTTVAWAAQLRTRWCVLSRRGSSKWRPRSSLKCHIRMEIQTLAHRLTRLHTHGSRRPAQGVRVGEHGN